MKTLTIEPEVRAVMVGRAVKAQHYYGWSEDWASQVLDRIINRFNEKPDEREFVLDELTWYGFISELQAIRIEKGMDWTQL